MTALIKTTALTGFPQLVRELGGNPDEILRMFNIAPAVLESGSNVVPYRALIGMLEYAAEVLQCPDFGLQLAERQSLMILGPLAVVAQNSQTVGEAMQEIGKYLHTYCPGAHLELDSHSDPAHPQLIFDVRLNAIHRMRQTLELSLGVIHKALQMLYGMGFRAESVLFRNSSPLPQSRYQRYFGAYTYFGQACNALVLRPEHLSKTIDQHNSVLHDTMLDYITSAVLANSLGVHSQAEDLIKRLLPTQRCTLPLIAERLGLHERALQRRLAEHGLLFEDMLDHVRQELSDIYLAESHMPMAQVAALLGYAEQSSFNRACKRWHATSPRKRRQQLRQQSL